MRISRIPSTFTRHDSHIRNTFGIQEVDFFPSMEVGIWMGKGSERGVFLHFNPSYTYPVSPLTRLNIATLGFVFQLSVVYAPKYISSDGQSGICALRHGFCL